MGQLLRSDAPASVGAIESVLHSWLMEGVHRLRTSHPTLALELTVETSPVLVDQLARSEAVAAKAEFERKVPKIAYVTRL